MKIVVILKSFANKAGTERIFCDKYNALAAKGYDITFITYEQGQHPLSFQLHPSIKVIDIPTPFFRLMQHPIYTRYFHYVAMKRRFRTALKSILDDIRPDLIVTTTYSLKVADVIVQQKGNAKSILESHIAFRSVMKSSEYRKYSPLWFVAKYFDWSYCRAIRKFDEMVVLTSGDQRDIKPVRETIVIPNVVNLSSHHVRDYSVKRMIAVGRLERDKGFDILLDVWKGLQDRYPDWEIHIYGQGGKREELQRTIDQNGMKNNVFLEEPTSEILNRMCDSSILLFPSRIEGFGLVLAEAMSCGLPVVAFDCPHGPADIVTDGQDGYLVHAGDTSRFAQCMSLLMEHPEQRKQMGTAGIQSSQRFSAEVIMPRWEQLFESIVK